MYTSGNISSVREYVSEINTGRELLLKYISKDAIDSLNNVFDNMSNDNILDVLRLYGAVRVANSFDKLVNPDTGSVIEKDGEFDLLNAEDYFEYFVSNSSVEYSPRHGYSDHTIPLVYKGCKPKHDYDYVTSKISSRVSMDAVTQIRPEEINDLDTYIESTLPGVRSKTRYPSFYKDVFCPYSSEVKANMDMELKALLDFNNSVKEPVVYTGWPIDQVERYPSFWKKLRDNDIIVHNSIWDYARFQILTVSDLDENINLFVGRHARYASRYSSKDDLGQVERAYVSLAKKYRKVCVFLPLDVGSIEKGRKIIYPGTYFTAASMHRSRVYMTNTRVGAHFLPLTEANAVIFRRLNLILSRFRNEMYKYPNVTFSKSRSIKEPLLRIGIRDTMDMMRHFGFFDMDWRINIMRTCKNIRTVRQGGNAQVEMARLIKVFGYRSDLYKHKGENPEKIINQVMLDKFISQCNQPYMISQGYLKVINQSGHRYLISNKGYEFAFQLPYSQTYGEGYGRIDVPNFIAIDFQNIPKVDISKTVADCKEHYSNCYCNFCQTYRWEYQHWLNNFDPPTNQVNQEFTYGTSLPRSIGEVSVFKEQLERKLDTHLNSMMRSKKKKKHLKWVMKVDYDSIILTELVKEVKRVNGISLDRALDICRMVVPNYSLGMLKANVRDNLGDVVVIKGQQVILNRIN